MAGLLGDVLPWVYSRSNALQRGLLDTFRNPVDSVAQTAGLLQDKRREHNKLMDVAFSDPQAPFKVTDQRALDQVTGNALSGILGFAPVGMTKYVDFTSGKYAPDITMDEMRAIMDVPTVEKMRIALDAAGDDAFKSMVEKQFKAYRPKTPDQESLLVESVLNQIVAKMRR